MFLKVSPVGTESRKLPSRRLSLTSNSSSPVKRPLAPVQPKSTTRVPASRSSSSGSSIGPTVRRPKVTHGLSTSFKVLKPIKNLWNDIVFGELNSLNKQKKKKLKIFKKIQYSSLANGTFKVIFQKLLRFNYLNY